MSTFNVKSTVIANRDATPSVLTDPILAMGMVQEVIGCQQLPQTAGAGSQARLVSMPSSARISSIEYFNAQLGTSALDIAAWYPTTIQVQSGIVAAQMISSSTFAQNIAGVDTGTVADGYGTIAQASVQKRCQPLWQALGLASDPNVMIDLGFTVRTANSIAGYTGLRVRYTR
jgi:hypothetical protein